MAARILLLGLASVLSGCTNSSLVRDLFIPGCIGTKVIRETREAACMTAAAVYEIAREENEPSRDKSTADEDRDKETDPRFEEWIP